MRAVRLYLFSKLLQYSAILNMDSIFFCPVISVVSPFVGFWLEWRIWSQEINPYSHLTKFSDPHLKEKNEGWWSAPDLAMCFHYT